MKKQSKVLNIAELTFTANASGGGLVYIKEAILASLEKIVPEAFNENIKSYILHVDDKKVFVSDDEGVRVEGDIICTGWIKWELLATLYFKFVTSRLFGNTEASNFKMGFLMNKDNHYSQMEIEV